VHEQHRKRRLGRIQRATHQLQLHLATHEPPPARPPQPIRNRLRRRATTRARDPRIAHHAQYPRPASARQVRDPLLEVGSR
jgi:hypothetical protein